MADGDRWISAALFVTVGLVAAFTVSAVAGLWDDEPADTGLRAFGTGVDRPGDIQVEVLNGAGTTGIARGATYRLRSDGFDVVFFGNADHFRHERSVVIDRVGQPAQARAVAASLGIDSVATAVDSSLLLQVTVVLGDDWPPPRPRPTDWLDRLRELLAPGDTTDEPPPPDTAGATGP